MHAACANLETLTVREGRQSRKTTHHASAPRKHPGGKQGPGTEDTVGR